MNALKAATSIPVKDTIPRSWQKTIDFVNGLKGKLPDDELAMIKKYVEKRSRDEAAKVHVTVKPVGTVQHCSPCSPNPDRPSGVYFNLENEERMEMDELKSTSAGTGLKTPGQQCPPYEGTWEQGRTIANGILTAGVDSSQKENISSPTTESVGKREKSTATVAGISSTAATPENRRLKTFSEPNKQFDPGGRREKAPPWDAAVTVPSFSVEKLGGFLSVFYLCSVYALCVFVVRNYFFSTGDHFSPKLKETRALDADRVAEARNRRASILSPIAF